MFSDTTKKDFYKLFNNTIMKGQDSSTYISSDDPAGANKTYWRVNAMIVADKFNALTLLQSISYHKNIDNTISIEVPDKYLTIWKGYTTYEQRTLINIVNTWDCYCTDNKIDWKVCFDNVNYKNQMLCFSKDLCLSVTKVSQKEYLKNIQK